MNSQEICVDLLSTIETYIENEGIDPESVEWLGRKIQEKAAVMEGES